MHKRKHRTDLKTCKWIKAAQSFCCLFVLFRLLYGNKFPPNSIYCLRTVPFSYHLLVNLPITWCKKKTLHPFHIQRCVWYSHLCVVYWLHSSSPLLCQYGNMLRFTLHKSQFVYFCMEISNCFKITISILIWEEGMKINIGTSYATFLSSCFEK